MFSFIPSGKEEEEQCEGQAFDFKDNKYIPNNTGRYMIKRGEWGGLYTAMYDKNYKISEIGLALKKLTPHERKILKLE